MSSFSSILGIIVVAFPNLVEPMAIEDGELASSGYRVVSLIDILEAPYIAPAHRDVFHIGPVNVKRPSPARCARCARCMFWGRGEASNLEPLKGFPELLAAGRPYYDLPLYTGQLDEVWTA